MNITYWNTGKCTDVSFVGSIAAESNSDVLILAEWTGGVEALVSELNEKADRLYYPDPGVNERLTIVSRLPRSGVRSIADYRKVAIRHYAPPLGESVLLVAVHLPSKWGMSDISQASYCGRVASYVRKAENIVGHRRTVIMGDFNMNPFEPGMVSSEGLHAVMDQRVARRGQRVVDGEERHFMYNPMWSLLGDETEGPAGTYYYGNSEPVVYFWNSFDQVLVRPALLDSLAAGSGVRVVESAGGTPLLGENQRPRAGQFSDHLPLNLSLDLELNL